MKKFVPYVLTAVVVGALAFYAGTKFGVPSDAFGAGQAGGRNRFQQMGAGGMAGVGGRANGGNGAFGNLVNGEIISSDDKSITVKLREGGTKIVFFSGTTKIMKSIEGTPSDIITGKDVVITGTANSDGSVTAQSVQIRPPMPIAATVTPAAK